MTAGEASELSVEFSYTLQHGETLPGRQSSSGPPGPGPVLTHLGFQPLSLVSTQEMFLK